MDFEVLGFGFWDFGAALFLTTRAFGFFNGFAPRAFAALAFGRPAGVFLADGFAPDLRFAGAFAFAVFFAAFRGGFGFLERTGFFPAFAMQKKRRTSDINLIRGEPLENRCRLVQEREIIRGVVIHHIDEALLCEAEGRAHLMLAENAEKHRGFRVLPPEIAKDPFELGQAVREDARTAQEEDIGRRQSPIVKFGVWDYAAVSASIRIPEHHGLEHIALAFETAVVHNAKQ